MKEAWTLEVILAINLKKVWIVLNKKCFIFLVYKKLEKRKAVEFLFKKKISSLIAACSFLCVRFLFAGPYCIDRIKHEQP